MENQQEDFAFLFHYFSLFKSSSSNSYLLFGLVIFVRIAFKLNLKFLALSGENLEIFSADEFVGDLSVFLFALFFLIVSFDILLPLNIDDLSSGLFSSRELRLSFPPFTFLISEMYLTSFSYLYGLKFYFYLIFFMYYSIKFTFNCLKKTALIKDVYFIKWEINKNKFIYCWIFSYFYFQI